MPSEYLNNLINKLVFQQVESDIWALEKYTQGTVNYLSIIQWTNKTIKKSYSEKQIYNTEGGVIIW